MVEKSLNILGIRGLPAAHGGFETFAAHLAPYMRDHGWAVSVYCQEEEGVRRPKSWTDDWEGIRRVHFETRSRGAAATIEFDMRCVLDVLKRPGIDLVLGYNTAIFNVVQRLAGRRVVMNMDGIEWKRAKWGTLAKAWFYANEWIGAHACTVPIADHPEIAAHLAARGCRRAVVIPYGSDAITEAPEEPLARFSLSPGRYFISIARIEPENSILEIVDAFSRAGTDYKLMVLGRLEPGSNAYHARVRRAASANVIFPGAIYDRDVLRSLRFHCLAYLHGHQVGGTNPSLVEALGAGNAIIARDNKFNRWVAGNQQSFFTSEAECAAHLKEVSSDQRRTRMRTVARTRHSAEFQWSIVLNAYHEVFSVIAGHSTKTNSHELLGRIGDHTAVFDTAERAET